MLRDRVVDYAATMSDPTVAAPDDLPLLRRLGFWEGMSFLVLLGGAMPLKYAADLPIAVTIVGPIHGILFVVVCYYAWAVRGQRGWGLGFVAKVVVAALLPFGPFVIDRQLRDAAE